MMKASSSARHGKPKIGFALGGIAGSNAHGIGFLQAASEVGFSPDGEFRPDTVSCTSGMIYWFWRWLEKADLRAELSKAIAQAEPFPFEPLNWWYTMTFGLPGVFRAAQPEFWRRLFSLPAPSTAEQILDRLLPAQMWVPTRPETDFEAIARKFNESDFPIFFNSFSPHDGIEHLHMNEAARGKYEEQKRHRARLRPQIKETADRLASHLPEVEPTPIDAEAVADALWLTWYGFEGPKGGDGRKRRIDGAYARQFILSELTSADILFMARPQSHRFIGAPPANYFGVQDLQTELWFNGSYTQQLARLDLINRLIRSGALKGEDYHEITLVPVEIRVQRGYFAYFMESMKVFDHARAQATRAFQEYLPGIAAPAPKPADRAPGRAGRGRGQPSVEAGVGTVLQQAEGG